MKPYVSKGHTLKNLRKYVRLSQDVDGWFNIESAAVWASLLELQNQRKIHGDFLEIGVFKGKSAILSSLYARENERCVFVDPVVTNEAKSAVMSVRKSNNIFIEALSGTIQNDARLYEKGTEAYRWIHVDGEHTQEQVIGDLQIAEKLLHKTGIIAIDDFFSANYPQVTSGVFQFLEQARGRFSMFLCGYNKGYLARPVASLIYLEHIAKQMMADFKSVGLNTVSLAKTTHPQDMNCFGLVSRWSGRDYVGPAWNADLISY